MEQEGDEHHVFEARAMNEYGTGYCCDDNLFRSSLAFMSTTDARQQDGG